MTLYNCCKEALTEGVRLIRPRSALGNYTWNGESEMEYDCKPYTGGNKRGWTALDTFSASAYTQVYEALSHANKVKLGSLSHIKAFNARERSLK